MLCSGAEVEAMNLFFIVKILISASVLALASELSKRSSLVAAITLALPLTSLLALIWIHFESHDKAKLAAISWDVFWLVPPSLAFFPCFAWLMMRDVHFWLSFFLAALTTVAVYAAYAKILAVFGIKL
jgi:hypothetical protein